MTDDFHIFRGHLPQFRVPCGIYFITWSLDESIKDHLCPEEKTIVLEQIIHFKDEWYRLDSVVVMHDHAHVLIQTLAGIDLGKILKHWKGPTARKINLHRRRTGTLWNKDSHTQLLDGDRIIQSRRNYIYQNPYRKWGIEPSSYEWLRTWN